MKYIAKCTSVSKDVKIAIYLHVTSLNLHYLESYYSLFDSCHTVVCGFEMNTKEAYSVLNK